jgi:hypothetical protein
MGIVYGSFSAIDVAAILLAIDNYCQAWCPTRRRENPSLRLKIAENEGRAYFVRE